MEKTFQKKTAPVRPKHSGELGEGVMSRNSSVSPFPSGIRVQAQLETTAPGDEQEKEADTTADLVLRKIETGSSEEEMPDLSVQSHPSVSASGGSSVSIPSHMESRLSSSLGAGQALPGGVRSQMEGAFGQPFSNVRIHTDSAAAEMSRSICARAFTYGNDIFFSQGQYSPYSYSGQHLLAHELTHTLQQGGKVARWGEKEDPPHIRIPKNARKFPNVTFWRKMIKYLCQLTDDDVVDSYFDALTRGWEFTFFSTYYDKWVDNLESYGKKGYANWIPKAFFSDDYQEEIAKAHWRKIVGKMKSVRVKRQTPTGGQLGEKAVLHLQCMSVMESNNEDRKIPADIAAIENAMLRYIDERNRPGVDHPEIFKTVDTRIFEWMFLGMLITPWVGAFSVAVAVAGTAGASALGSSALASLATTAATTTGGKIGFSAIKNGISSGLEIYGDDAETRNKDGYWLEKTIDYFLSVAIDTADVGVSSLLGDPKKDAYKFLKKALLSATLAALKEVQKNGIAEFDLKSFAANVAAGTISALGEFDELKNLAGLDSVISTMASLIANMIGGDMSSLPKDFKIDPKSELGQQMEQVQSLRDTYSGYIGLLLAARMNKI